MENEINITVIDREGVAHELQAPTDMGMNLMEICKAFELPLQGVCGGMGICGSCHVYIESDHELPEQSDEELATLSESFQTEDNSRLSCQIRAEESLEGLIIRLAPEDA